MIGASTDDPDSPEQESTRDVIKAALDVCREYEYPAIVQDYVLCGALDLQYKVEERHIKQVLDSFADYRDIILGFFAWDEPLTTHLEDARQRQEWVRKYDPDVRLFYNMLPSYGKYTWKDNSYKSYVDDVNRQLDPAMLSVDYYVFYLDSQGEPDVLSPTQELWKDMGYLRKLCKETGKPFEFYIQGTDVFGGSTPNRIPYMTAEKLGFQTYAALAYGAKRISCFTTYGLLLDDNGNKTRLYNDVKELNREALKVGEFLFDKTPDKIYHSGAGSLPAVREQYFVDDLAQSPLLSEIPSETIVSTFRDQAGGHYLMIANKDYAFPTEGKLVFKKEQQLYRLNAIAGRLDPLPAPVKSLALNIPAGGYALYKIA